MQSIARCCGYSEVAKMITSDIIRIRVGQENHLHSHKPLVGRSNRPVATDKRPDHRQAAFAIGE